MLEIYYDKLQPYFGQKNYSITLDRYWRIHIECQNKTYYQRHKKLGRYI